MKEDQQQVVLSILFRGLQSQNQSPIQLITSLLTFPNVRASFSESNIMAIHSDEHFRYINSGIVASYGMKSPCFYIKAMKWNIRINEW